MGFARLLFNDDNNKYTNTDKNKTAQNSARRRPSVRKGFVLSASVCVCAL